MRLLRVSLLLLLLLVVVGGGAFGLLPVGGATLEAEVAAREASLPRRPLDLDRNDLLPAMAAPAPMPASLQPGSDGLERVVTARAPEPVEAEVRTVGRSPAEEPIRLSLRPAVLRRAPPRGPPASA